MQVHCTLKGKLIFSSVSTFEFLFIEIYLIIFVLHCPTALSYACS